MVVDIGDGTVNGAPVIVPLVHECDPSAKQSRVAASGKAYLRGYDSDFQLSHLEEQAFIAARRDQLIYDLLASAPRTAAELAAQTQLFADTVRRSLRALRIRDLSGSMGDEAGNHLSTGVT